MTRIHAMKSHITRLSDLGTLERLFLDVTVPVCSALFGLAAVWIAQPHVVGNAVYRVQRFTHALFG